MSLIVTTSAAPVGIQHRVSAGGGFDGPAPSTAVTFENGLNKYAASATGGLVYFENRRPVSLVSYHASFGGEVPYQVAVVSLDSSGTPLPGERSVIAEGVGTFTTGPMQYGFVLGPHQALQVLTDGSTGAEMIVQAWAVDATALIAG